MPDVFLHLWKDEEGCRLRFEKGDEAIDLDLSFEAAEKLTAAVTEFNADEPAGAYREYGFDLQDYVEGDD